VAIVCVTLLLPASGRRGPQQEGVEQRGKLYRQPLGHGARARHAVPAFRLLHGLSSGCYRLLGRSTHVAISGLRVDAGVSILLRHTASPMPT